MNVNQLLFAAMFATAIGAPSDGFAGDSPLSALRSATGWLNSAPLTPADLHGKVVLVDIWTYTCVNWLRTLPYVRAWAAKYKDQGLVVVGVHSPEFSFEKDAANVRRAVANLKVDYPVAIDSDHAIWRAFDNQYWPALYFIDAQGRIRERHFGEGEYERSEKIIQRLLAENGSRATGTDTVAVNPIGVEVSADWKNLKSPENYLGYGRTERFASPGGIARDKSRPYAVPTQLKLNQWALSGIWTIKAEASTTAAPNGRLVYRFHARDVNLVTGPAAGGAAVRFRVLIDGQPPADARGVDIDPQGNGTVTDQRMYQLVRQTNPIVDRLIEIEFLDPGVELYAFTFG